ncbi:MAG: TerB family tellurite resistance protein [Gammaproteobacteria bacterium]|nr:TerB family tellurite resistance protein [Gammaproteobacteria bacterium]
MIRRFLVDVIEAISTSDSDPAGSVDRDAALRKATAVLMLDVARADQVFEKSELDRVLELVESHFGLSAEEAAELVDTASGEAEDLTSVHQFTQLLHEHLGEDEKARIVSLLWQIAYADGHLDKYENSLVLKISDLLYVSRGRVMRLKHDAERAAG